MAMLPSPFRSLILPVRTISSEMEEDKMVWPREMVLGHTILSYAASFTSPYLSLWSGLPLTIGRKRRRDGRYEEKE